MAILYPPYIEGTIPAFVGNTIEVPYMMNKTVGYGDIKGFRLKVKNIQTNKTLATLTSSDYDEAESIVYFTLDDSTSLSSKKFYKIQLAYVSDANETGYFSTVGIIKKTNKPTVKIIKKNGEELNKNITQPNTITYVGYYRNEDSGEKVYSYRFDVYDYKGQLFATSGDILHNHENDSSSTTTQDEFTLNGTLEDDQVYKIKYTVTTVNGYIKSSSEYKIAQSISIDPLIHATLQAKLCEEDGYIDVRFKELPDDEDKIKFGLSATGTFIIYRASSEDNFTNWNMISNFALYGQLPGTWSWKDYTISNGVQYMYALQQFNKTNQIYSNKRYSNIVTAAFEHCYLYDGERQLKIKFNPKINSYKRNVLEQKQDTLGGKFPYFYRNGNTDYKEFPISGLISYLSDENELFLTDEELGLHGENTFDNNRLIWRNNHKTSSRDTRSRTSVSETNRVRTTNLVNYNIAAEKIFKNKVLEFLTNGKPKLFKSPSESNAIVRLMNTSLTPNEQLGRMLHTFNTTAYEVDELTYENLDKYGFIHRTDPYIKQIRVCTIDVRDFLDENENEPSKQINQYTAQFIDFKDMVPGDKVYLDDICYVIGATGSYSVHIKGKSFKTIRLNQKSAKNNVHSKQGTVTYGYYATDFDAFSLYEKINVTDTPLIWEFGSGNTENSSPINILAPYEDIKYKIANFHFLRFSKKEIATLTDYNNNISKTSIKDFYIIKKTDGDNPEGYNGLCLLDDDSYKIKIVQTVYKVDENGKILSSTEDEEVILDLKDIDGYQLYSHNNIKELYIGNGIIAEMCMSRVEQVYTLETTDFNIRQAKQDYITALNTFNKDHTNEQAVTDKYNAFIKALTEKYNSLRWGEGDE